MYLPCCPLYQLGNTNPKPTRNVSWAWNMLKIYSLVRIPIILQILTCYAKFLIGLQLQGTFYQSNPILTKHGCRSDKMADTPSQISDEKLNIISAMILCNAMQCTNTLSGGNIILHDCVTFTIPDLTGIFQKPCANMAILHLFSLTTGF